ncbi:MAG: imidazole glycerol phosphate synthase subunit HisH [Bacteroidetes bacterium]|nr:imidazole glycerol phosphate synthase subunit HisH [Bacteroidota bacterium]
MGGKIGILHYGCGNMRSVINAFEHLGVDPVVVADSRDVSKVDKLVLPGVGAFDTAMERLRVNSFVDSLNEHVVRKKKPILGICLGMQLLCKSSTEGSMPGLAFIDTHVKILPGKNKGLKIPHMGWNSIKFTRDSFLFRGIRNLSDFYFVHSYCVIIEDKSFVIGETLYGEPFVSALQKDNILGIQFHPEKSHKIGLRMIQNFIDF